VRLLHLLLHNIFLKLLGLVISLDLPVKILYQTLWLSAARILLLLTYIIELFLYLGHPPTLPVVVRVIVGLQLRAALEEDGPHPVLLALVDEGL
jgi:hypothetical protein